VFKRLIKAIIKPIYLPFYRRFVQPLRDIQARLYELGDRIGEVELNVGERVNATERSVNERVSEMEQSVSGRVNAVERSASKYVSDAARGAGERFSAMERSIGAMERGLSERVSAAERSFGERLRAAERSVNERAAVAERSIGERISVVEQNINRVTDARIWKAEKSIVSKEDRILDEVHRHIDYTYRDILVALDSVDNFIERRNVVIITDYPVAYESLDHLFPRGTKNDNTRYPRFIHKCETLFSGKEKLNFCDLGCSGGGMVLDAALRGHYSVGIEGSDLSSRAQRAEWRLLRKNLFTADITKPLGIIDLDTQETVTFDVISAWEVVEHLSEGQLFGLFDNVAKHLADDGVFVGSIANYSDKQPETGTELHVTQQPYEWWSDKFSTYGFEAHQELFDYADLARGGYNGPVPWEKESTQINVEKCFYFCCGKKRRVAQ
jgi:2-polyprenyl-3-methyl-5-hydroxy-6-metoxy-1,4-benzoquinol methylase